MLHLIIPFFKLILDFIVELITGILKIRKEQPQAQPQPAPTQPPPPQPQPLPAPHPMIINEFTIPPKSTSMATGSEFVQSIMNIGADQHREDVIFQQYQLGNVPDFMRNSIEITIIAGNNTVKYHVLPDFLCVGTDDDYIHTPLNPLTARKVADLFGGVLPTPKMAHQIWQSASIKMTPSPNGPPYDGSMQSTAKLWEHEQRIRAALQGTLPGPLIAGHKKDVVYCQHLLTDPSRVAIVGWWYPDGRIIQPLNPVSHSRIYYDYAHGIRIVSRTILFNDQPVDFYSALKNPAIAPFLSDEGPFDASQIYTR